MAKSIFRSFCPPSEIKMSDPNDITPSLSTIVHFRVGVAGWTYPDWKGLVYPRESKLDRLEYLSAFFDTIEINTSFYSIPTTKIVERWIQSVKANPRFSFCAKLYKHFTHGTDLDQGNPGLDSSVASSFKNSFRPMLDSGLLGILLIQFPYRFHHTGANLDHIKRVFELFRGFPLAAEFRHRSFYRQSFFEFLKQEYVAFANIDQPQISYSMPSASILTHPSLAYLRLHGRNSKTWFADDAGVAERYDYDYSQEEYEKYFEMIREVKKKNGVLYIIFNNHYRAHQIKNALEFLNHFTGSPVLVMTKLMEAYPTLKSIACPATPANESTRQLTMLPLFDIEPR
jgi:uncharacterized protein YecE (DUF72 family)